MKEREWSSPALLVKPAAVSPCEPSEPAGYAPGYAITTGASKVGILGCHAGAGPVPEAKNFGLGPLNSLRHGAAIAEMGHP